MTDSALATPPLKDSVAFDLSITHANCGLCTAQLNLHLPTSHEADHSRLLKNLKSSKKHLERSLHFAEIIDGSSGSSNRDHEEYVRGRLATVLVEIKQLKLKGTAKKETRGGDSDGAVTSDHDAERAKAPRPSTKTATTTTASSGTASDKTDDINGAGSAPAAPGTSGKKTKKKLMRRKKTQLTGANEL